MSVPEFLCYLSSHCFTKESKLSTIFIKRASLLKSFFFVTTILTFPFFLTISWLRILFKKFFRIKPSVIWCPTPILNIIESSKLLNTLGFKNKTLVFTVYHITNEFDYNLQKVNANPAMSWWYPHILFMWSLCCFDIYHFYYDSGLWSGMKILPKARWLELILLRVAGKRIIASAYGGDVRTKRRNNMWLPWNLCVECPEVGRHCLCDDTQGAKISKYYRQWCNEILAMGDMHDYIYGSKPDFIYWPIDLNRVQYKGSNVNSETITIAHSPNHRHFKGTRFIEQSIRKLVEQGYNIKLDIIEKISNIEAIERYGNADIIFAQCILGWPGFTEIEGMAAGKPVLTNVRDPERYLGHLPSWPAINVNPDTMDGVLLELIKNPQKRIELGEKGRKHVEEHWSYDACSSSYHALHDKVWRENGLFQIVRKKFFDILSGTLAYSYERDNLIKYPIAWDHSESLLRIKWGLYGRPIKCNQGILQVVIDNQFNKHPGVLALYCLDLFHVWLKSKCPEVKKEFITQSEALFSIIKQKIKIPSIPSFVIEIPFWCNAYHSLSISVFERVHFLTRESKSKQLADELTALLFKPIDNLIGWYDDEGYQYPVDNFLHYQPKYLMNILVACVSLYDYALINNQVPNYICKFKEVSKSIVNLLSDIDLFVIIDVDYLAADFKSEEFYFLVQSLYMLADISSNSELLKLSKRIHRQIIFTRVKRFCQFKDPL